MLTLKIVLAMLSKIPPSNRNINKTLVYTVDLKLRPTFRMLTRRGWGGTGAGGFAFRCLWSFRRLGRFRFLFFLFRFLFSLPLFLSFPSCAGIFIHTGWEIVNLRIRRSHVRWSHDHSRACSCWRTHWIVLSLSLSNIFDQNKDRYFKSKKEREEYGQYLWHVWSRSRPSHRVGLRPWHASTPTLSLKCGHALMQLGYLLLGLRI